MGMGKDVVAILDGTLKALDDGFVEVDGTKIEISCTREHMAEALVLLPGEVRACSNQPRFKITGPDGLATVHTVRDEDALSVARERITELGDTIDGRSVLVLNFAHPAIPGGDARKGGLGQEQDLCCKSSLLLSLESESAKRFYDYHRQLLTHMASDALIFSPHVVVVRDKDFAPLLEPFECSVMSCSAPAVAHGLQGMEREAYEHMLLVRIERMLKCAAFFGYRNLVLGAWGCGTCGNDAHLVAELFRKALQELDYNGSREDDLFETIDFAIPDRLPDRRTLRTFETVFMVGERKFDEPVGRREDRDVLVQPTQNRLDRIRGCLVGGAIGDALGYPVEFLTEKTLFAHYGEDGILSYVLDEESGKALISDDTQMSLFTAVGLLFHETQAALFGVTEMPRTSIMYAYLDWLETQQPLRQSAEANHPRVSWLLDVNELYARRAPGNTCLSALRDIEESPQHIEDFTAYKRNDSKGCGGIMRVAPLALAYNMKDLPKLDMEAAQIAAITHGHSLGYMSAAVLAHILNRIVFAKEALSLKALVLEAKDAVAQIFEGDPHINELCSIIDNAVELAQNNMPDLENIHRLGQGWVAEETLAIALYCAIRHGDDFNAGVRAAVNHGGDSDSTGAVAGNIIGAIVGYEAIDSSWKHDLELSDVILELADDLCQGCRMTPSGGYQDKAWLQKYVACQRKATDAAKTKTQIHVIRGDLTQATGVSAIVNPARKSLLGGGGLDGAIHKAAGPQLRAECAGLGGCEVGQAKLTRGYKLPCDYVIHTVGPIWRGGGFGEQEQLESCYRESLSLAADNGIRTIAFPSIATGSYSYPLKHAARVAVRTVREFVDEHPDAFDEIRWVLYDERTFDAYEEALEYSGMVSPASIKD